MHNAIAVQIVHSLIICEVLVQDMVNVLAACLLFQRQFQNKWPSLEFKPVCESIDDPREKRVLKTIIKRRF